ncbi:MAG: HAMP domain-containing protein, partial [Prolixibacteraceae bacterium]|nr:HAMP domain-containing protein [Prolixibacteraceae bacterium]
MKQTIRGKLSVLYSVVMFTLLTGFCIILYHAIGFSFQSKTRNELLTYAHKLSERFDNKTQTFTDLPEGDFNANPLYWFRMIKPDASLYRPAPVFSVMGNTASTLKIARSSKTDHWFYNFKEEGQWFSSVISPVNEGKQFSGWVEVVVPVSEGKKILSRIAILMFSLGVVIVLLLFFSGRFLARKTLAPVEQIRRQVDAIYEKNLSSRIISPNPSDELGQLAGTFNLLLQRLEKAFDSQQQFIADASHELKTPLTILRTHWEKLAAQKDIPYNHRIRIQSDVDELVRLSSMINNLLLLSSTKEKIFHPEIFSLWLRITAIGCLSWKRVGLIHPHPIECGYGDCK